MENQFPDGMRQSIIVSLQAAIDNASALGWSVTAIKWQNQPGRMVEFSAKYESGRSVYSMCSEQDLLERIQDLVSRRFLP
jgi:hypothetical protein